MTLRPLRLLSIIIAIVLAAGCSGGESETVDDEFGIDDTGLIATFDVGYEVPLDDPGDLVATGTIQTDEPASGDTATDESPAAVEAMPDEDNEPSAATPDVASDADTPNAEDPPDGLAMSDDSNTDPNKRSDGLTYVRTPVFDDGRWQSIALVAPDGNVVWSYNGCDENGCTHDDFLVLPNGNVAVTATSMVDGRLVDNVLELEPVVGDACAAATWCTGVARQSAANIAVPDGLASAIALTGAAADYGSWDVVSSVDGSPSTIIAA